MCEGNSALQRCPRERTKKKTGAFHAKKKRLWVERLRLLGRVQRNGDSSSSNRPMLGQAMACTAPCWRPGLRPSRLPGRHNSASHRRRDARVEDAPPRSARDRHRLLQPGIIFFVVQSFYKKIRVWEPATRNREKKGGVVPVTRT